MKPIYDSIGIGYTATRAADPRITRRLIELLELPRGSKILDVGAGTGNYSFSLAQAGYSVAALEPSLVMREQDKQHSMLSWIAAFAESLPFPPESFDGAVMTLCMHHFTNWAAALSEASRVVGDGPIVILTFDSHSGSKSWLFDYFPGFLQQDRKQFPRLEDLSTYTQETLSRNLEVHRFPLPSDLVDHFASAGWARPENYLNENYRSGISSFASANSNSLSLGLQKLESDLASGKWDSKYGELRSQRSLDAGYVFLKIG